MKITSLSTTLLHHLMIESATFRQFMIEKITMEDRAEFVSTVKTLVQKFSPWNEKIPAIKELRTFSQNNMESFRLHYGPLTVHSTDSLGLADAKRIVELYL